MKKKHTGNFFEKNMGKLLLLLLPFLILILSALSKYEAVLTEALFFVEMAFVLMLVFQVVSPVLGLLVLPFIPLYLIAPYTVWFYVVLFLYCGIFACIGRMKLYYRWTEIIISICFFLS